MKSFDFKRLLTITLAIGVLVASSAWTDSHAAESGKATKVTTVEGITEYRLENGLRFLLFPDRSQETITVNITYLVGSRHEAYGETGMAHLLEHLVFKGTPNHPDISKELTERGAAPNGTTWLDRTNYFETLTATDDNLEWAIGLEADRMVNSFIAKEDLDSEMTVVRNEWESGENNPGRVLFKRLLSTAFHWHNYGNSTIGARSDIENVPIERLQAFYRKYYQPDNAILVVAGKFEEARALELIEEKFGSIPVPDRSGDNRIYETYTIEPAQDGERTVTLKRVGDTQYVRVGWHIPAASHPSTPAIDVLAHVLGDSVSGRFEKELVKKELAASAFAFALQGRDPGLLIAGATVTKDKDLKAAEAAVLQTVADIASGSPPTEEEVQRAKVEYLTSMELAFNNPRAIALQISEWASQGDWRLMFLYRDNLEKVKVEDVAEAAKTYLIDSNRTIAYFLPTEETPPRVTIPAAPDIDELVAGYQGREAVAEGEDFDPSPMNIENRTEFLTLKSGVRVALLEKENRGDQVSVSIRLSHGNEETLNGMTRVAQIAGSMLMRGTKNKTREEIYDRLAELKAQGGIGGGQFNISGNFTTVRESLPEVLGLAKEILREPRFDETEFKTLIEQNVAGIESSMSEPNYLTNLALQQYLTPYPKGHPLYSATAEEQLEELRSMTIEDVKDFAKRFHGVAEMARVVIVGDFDRDVVIPILEDMFADWKSQTPYSRVESKFFDQEAKSKDIDTPDKTNAIMLAGLLVPMGDEHEDYPAMLVGNHLLGGGFLSSRLASRIRQKEGYSYGVGAGFGASPPDEVSRFWGYAIFAPENADLVRDAFFEEVEKVLADGFTEEEVADGIKGYLDSRQRRRAQDGTIANMLMSNMFLDRNMDFVVKLEEAIAKLTPEIVLQAMRRHLDVKKISVFRGGDFSKPLQEAGE